MLTSLNNVGARDFGQSYKIHQMMKDKGFDYLLDNCVKFELVKCKKHSGQHLSQRLVMSLKETRFS